MSKAIETPEQRSDRGCVMAERFGDLKDWTYHTEKRSRLTSSEQQEFDLAFVKARAVAGVRPAVDLALAEMRKKLANRLGKPTWRAAI